MGCLLSKVFRMVHSSEFREPKPPKKKSQREPVRELKHDLVPLNEAPRSVGKGKTYREGSGGLVYR